MALISRWSLRASLILTIRTGPWDAPGAFNIRVKWILLRVRACPAPPEGAGLTQPLRCRRNLARLPGKPLGDEVSVEPVFGRFGAEHGNLIVQGQARLGGVRVELSPVPHVLFRPEEVHLPSNAPGICWRGWQVPVPDYGGWVGCENLSIPHLNADAFVAVQAGRIDTNGFTRKQPADRQRVRSSLAEPFLLTVHGDPVWGGYRRKGRNGGDPVGIGIQPYPSAGGSREIMNDLAPFIDGASQASGQFSVVGGLSCVYHAAYDDVIGFIEGLSVGHGSPLNDD